MAIYSLNHKSIGKTTQDQPYTASAHVAYITRDRALGHLDGARMPLAREGAMDWFRSAEDGDRKNARVADKVMLALPRELDRGQRAALVRSFAEEVTRGRASWLAAFHDMGKDEKNPHCHLLIRDRDPETGRRVFGLSEVGSTQRLREIWERRANEALAAAGERARIDRRTLEAQGIAREPTVHIGVRAKQLVRRGEIPRSRARAVRNSCLARSRVRQVNYQNIDRGESRLAHNVALVRKNIYRSRGKDEEREFWAAIDRDSFERDMDMLRRAHGILPEPEYGRRDRSPADDFDLDL